jgi:hypothetical protein
MRRTAARIDSGTDCVPTAGAAFTRTAFFVFFRFLTIRYPLSASL